jgi:hypothetical protein
VTVVLGGPKEVKQFKSLAFREKLLEEHPNLQTLGVPKFRSSEWNWLGDVTRGDMDT